jgi:hypothetical protein
LQRFFIFLCQQVKGIMKRIIFICLIFILAGCKKYGPLSECIQSKVNEFRTSVHFQNASIKEYVFQEQLAYVFDNGSAVVDGASDVYDGHCNYLGSLGGFAGITKINGVEFSFNAEYKRTIWHN